MRWSLRKVSVYRFEYFPKLGENLPPVGLTTSTVSWGLYSPGPGVLEFGEVILFREEVKM